MDLLTSRRAEQLEDALTAVPRQAEGLEREVALVQALQRAGTETSPAPTDEFRTALRTRLMAVAAVQGVGAAAATPAPAAVSWRRRLGAVAAGLTASAVAVTGVAAAADQSLPGDPFYGVKRVVEDVQLRLADGAAEEGQRHLQFAEERVRELRELALGRDLDGRDEPLSAEDAARVEALLDDLDSEVRSAQRLLTEAFRAGDADAADRLARFAGSAEDALTEVLPELPAGVRARAQQSLALVLGVGTTAADLLLLRDCTSACDPVAAAPVVPDPGQAGEPAGCECPTAPPAPVVAPPPSGSPAPAPSATAQPAPSPSAAPPSPAGSGPTPSPSSSPAPPVPSAPLPLPTAPLPPVPLPPLVPGGTVTVPPLTGDGGVLDGALGAALVLPAGALTAATRRRRAASGQDEGTDGTDHRA